MGDDTCDFRVGWAWADITPDGPVMLAGQFHTRISEAVMDPISVTAMVFESAAPGAEPVRGVMVGCDLASICDPLIEAVRERLGTRLPELDPMCVVLNATHTHAAPESRTRVMGGEVASSIELELGAMDPTDYVAFAADRVTDAIVRAWNGREPAGIGFGLDHATVGYNRRNCYYSGETRMYGGLDDPDFSHAEGGADSGVNVLCTWDRNRRLTGVIVNLGCPSQLSEHVFEVSADFWCEARAALRERLGERLFILPQVSAAGDVTPPRPSTVPDWKALERMRRLKGISGRQDVANRITDAVARVVDVAAAEIDWHPAAAHHVEVLDLPSRKLSEQDAREASDQADQYEAIYNQLLGDLEADPQARQTSRWYVDATRARRRMNWNRSVVERYEREKRSPSTVAAEVHVLRLGEAAFATNRFELYQDFGLQIKARSKATQTFVVQLAGPGGYLPTRRSAANGSYGAVPASTLVGPDGGRILVNRTVDVIASLWPAVAAVGA